ncbi:MAG: tetratricopeptide repeat protein [Bacteroidetes bacterium]|nr:tetratricopeptide repeat protein [Bacteroidota bacterium]
MNKTIVIVVFLFFSFHYSSTAQEGLITCKDTVNIRFRAENRIMALQDRMNFITWGSTTKQDFDESYTTATKGQARLFYNDSVIISNDVDPQLIISNKWNENLYVKKYLNQLYSGYQKNDDDENTIFFKNIRCSNLKKTSYYYVNIYYDCEYKAKHTATGMTYPKFSRVAEMRVELTGKSGSGKNEWTVTINSISYANADAFQNDTKNEVTDIARAIDCDAAPDPISTAGGKASEQADKAEQAARRGLYEDAVSFIRRAISFDPSNTAYQLKLKDYQEKLSTVTGIEQNSRKWKEQADYAYKFRRYHFTDSLYSKLALLDAKYRDPNTELRKQQIQPILSKTEGLQGLFSRNQFDQIINSCSKDIQTDNKVTPELYFWRAKAYVASNNPKRALEDLSKATSMDENYLDAYELRAQTKMKNEDRAGALSDYAILKSKDPKNDYYFLSSARAQKEIGAYDKAIRDYESALQVNVDNPVTYFELGEVEFLSNENEIAAKNFTRAIEKRKIYPEANYYLGLIAMKESKSDRYQRAGNYFRLAISQGLNADLKNKIQQKADEFYTGVKGISNPQNSLVSLNSAIQLYDSKPDYFVARGNAYTKLGDLRKAIADYRTACNLENTDFQNHYLLGIAYFENEQLDSAKFSFLKSLDIRQNFYPAKIYLGHTYFKEKEYAKSISYFNEALTLKKDSARIYYYIGNAYSQLHQPQQALDFYAKALDRDEDDPDFNVGRGNVYFDLNEYKQAIKDYNHALGHNPELSEALFHKAQCLIRMEDYDPALTDLNKYLQKNSMDPEAFRLRGLCLVQKANYPMAIEDFKSAKKIDKSYVSEPVLNKKMAYSYLKLNDPIRAMDCISQILQTDSRNSEGLLYKGIALSMQNKNSEAMDSFKEAFATGSFSKKAIKNDPLLSSLSKNSDFIAICNQYLH